MKSILLAAAAAITITAPAFAAPITALGTFTPDSIETFESYAVGTDGPIISGIMSIDAFSWIVRAQEFTQNPDIFEGQYFGRGAQTVTLNFAQDVTHVGLGLLDPNLDNTQLQAFDRSGTLLETVFPATGSPGVGFSTYTGFERLAGDIAKIMIFPATGDLIAVDNIAWRAATPVPLPAPALLLIAGLGGLAIMRRKNA